MPSSRQFCTFFVEGQLFGVPVQQVQEVIRYQEMTRVPLASEIVRGLINLRGQIVTAIDLRRCLQIKPRADDWLPMNVVVRGADGAVSLLVDEIGDVLEVEQEAFEAPPETLRGPMRAMVQGVYKLDGQLLLVLDVAEVMATLEPANVPGSVPAAGRA